MLEAVEPASLELSLRAAERVEQDRERLHAHWKQRLERAEYEADRARRQYDAVDPENRLVARELERQWEQKLAERQTAGGGLRPVPGRAAAAPERRPIGSGSRRWRPTCRRCGAARRRPGRTGGRSCGC